MLFYDGDTDSEQQIQMGRAQSFSRLRERGFIAPSEAYVESILSMMWSADFYDSVRVLWFCFGVHIHHNIRVAIGIGESQRS